MPQMLYRPVWANRLDSRSYHKGSSPEQVADKCLRNQGKV